MNCVFKFDFWTFFCRVGIRWHQCKQHGRHRPKRLCWYVNVSVSCPTEADVSYPCKWSILFLLLLTPVFSGVLVLGFVVLDPPQQGGRGPHALQHKRVLLRHSLWRLQVCFTVTEEHLVMILAPLWAEHLFPICICVRSTGSSLMPQKKNADSLELIRSKAGRVFGRVRLRDAK